MKLKKHLSKGYISIQKQCPEPALGFSRMSLQDTQYMHNHILSSMNGSVLHTPPCPWDFSLAPTDVSTCQLGSDSFISSYIVFYCSKIINFKNYSFLYGKNGHKPIQKTKYDLGDVFATHMTEGANTTNTNQKTCQVCIFWLRMRLTKFC